MDFNNVLIARTPRSKVFGGNVYNHLLQELGPGYMEFQVKPEDDVDPQRQGFLLDVDVYQHPDRELYPFPKRTVRGKHVYFVQTFNDPGTDTMDPNTAFMEMLFVNDALARAGAEKITLVTPFLPYERQDRVDKPRASIAFRVIADCIQTNPKVSRLLTLDMHADQEQGFFDIPVDHMKALHLFVDDFYHQGDKYVAVAPDKGSLKKTDEYGEQTGLRVALVNKRRNEEGVEISFIVGEEEVMGKHGVIIDDLIASGGTIATAGKVIVGKGAIGASAYAAHFVGCPNKQGVPAEQTLRDAGINVVVTDSIPRSQRYLDQNRDWFNVRSITPSIGKAIYLMENRQSLTESELFFQPKPKKPVGN